MPRRFQLDGLTLEDVRARAAAEYGPRARIIAAERVITGGIGGFFGRQHFEATVEVPDPEPIDVPVVFDRASRMGIADLLADADADDDVVGATEPLEISTSSPRFDALLEELAPAPLAALPAAAAEPLRGVGDLLVVVGIRSDATAAARGLAQLAGAAPTAVQDSGTAGGAGGPTPRQRSLAARADGVRGQRPAILTVPVGRDVTTTADHVRALAGDQVWVAVDVGRKPEDTARWVAAVRAAADVHGVAALGATTTATPETVAELRLPVRWFDGADADSWG